MNKEEIEDILKKYHNEITEMDKNKIKEYIEQLEKNNDYWKGYTDKEAEAQKICRQCKYIKTARELENNRISNQAIEILRNRKRYRQLDCI